LSNISEISPPAGTKINFEAATAFARKIDISKHTIKLTSGHRGSRATLESGWLIIEEKWFPM